MARAIAFSNAADAKTNLTLRVSTLRLATTNGAEMIDIKPYDLGSFALAPHMSDPAALRVRWLCPDLFPLYGRCAGTMPMCEMLRFWTLQPVAVSVVEERGGNRYRGTAALTCNRVRKNILKEGMKTTGVVHGPCPKHGAWSTLPYDSRWRQLSWALVNHACAPQDGSRPRLGKYNSAPRRATLEPGQCLGRAARVSPRSRHWHLWALNPFREWPQMGGAGLYGPPLRPVLLHVIPPRAE